jgi:hypothetical protein
MTLNLKKLIKNILSDVKLIIKPSYVYKNSMHDSSDDDKLFKLNKGGLQTAWPFPIAPLFVSSLKRFEL